MAPNSPTKASAARSIGTTASASSSRSTSSSSTTRGGGARTGGTAAKSGTRTGTAQKEKDLSTATATDESYFSLSSATTSASSSRAPSRTGAGTGGAGVGNTTTASVRETRSRTRLALQNSTNRPLSRTGGAAASANTGTGSGAGKAPAAPASPTKSTSSATVPGLGVGVGVGRVKAQAKALESSAQPQTLQHKSSAATLRSVDGGSGSPTKGGVARPAPPERQDSTSSVVSSTGSCAAASSKTRATAKKLPASKISCFEVEDTEGIKAYLRIRPAPQEDKDYAEPYIQVLNETQVLMKPPREGASSSIRARVHASSLPTKYTFTRVFAPSIPAALTSPALSTPKASSNAATSPTNDQASFFQHTTLPLVRNLLSGESGLIFTYGVTNSGKSYTVLGGARKNEAGILPRALDVVFNSIQGRQLEDARIRPRGLVGVEILPPVHAQSDDASSTAEESGSISSSSANNTTVKSALAAAAAAANRRNPGRSASASASTTITPSGGAGGSMTLPQYDAETTTVPIDRNYRYSVWVSYVEVYNEKLFDLLDAAVGDSGAPYAGGGTSSGRSSGASGSNASPTKGGGGGGAGLAASFGITRSESLRTSNWSIASSSGRGSGSGASDMGIAQQQQQHGGSSQHITLNRRPLTLKNDPDPSAGGKYVAGLSEHRVTSVQEAQALLQRGTENRIVFGTLANRMSSRSHGVFTIKIIREHAGAAAAAAASGGRVEREFYTSRLSIVDLAGSERASNTGLMSGERLKEAGNINKSLMCLGQCLETIRKNQARMASLIPAPVSMAELPTSPSMTGTTGAVAMTMTPKRRLSVVPFRYSKLTELFQSFFPGPDGTGASAGSSSSSGGGGGTSGGGGRAVMIVNANPYDTGYDENSHVMKFSAVARDVQTVSRGGALPVAVYGNAGMAVVPSASVPAFGSSMMMMMGGRHQYGTAGGSLVGVPPIRFGPSATPRSTGTTAASAGASASASAAAPSSPTKKGAALPAATGTGAGVAKTNAGRAAGSGLSAVDPIEITSDGPEVTIIEISDDEDENDSDAFVDMLLEKHEELRQRVYECELEARLIEERVREEMTEQMERRMREMERMYMDRLLSDAADSEAFMNRKLDLLAGELDRERSVQAGNSNAFAKRSAAAAAALQRDSNPVTPTQARIRRLAAEDASVDESVDLSVSGPAEVEDSLLEEGEEEEGEETTEYLDGEEGVSHEDSLGFIASRRVDERDDAGIDHDDEEGEGGREDEDEDEQDEEEEVGDSLYLPH
ncbi:hypothetical protein OC835_000369 [Tilletia horrida]|nr:hypothetical protein OC835_000369 [Tilletia horrida]